MILNRMIYLEIKVYARESLQSVLSTFRRRLRNVSSINGTIAPHQQKRLSSARKNAF
jgi:hypothetical protein